MPVIGFSSYVIVLFELFYILTVQVNIIITIILYYVLGQPVRNISNCGFTEFSNERVDYYQKVKHAKY